MQTEEVTPNYTIETAKTPTTMNEVLLLLEKGEHLDKALDSYFESVGTAAENTQDVESPQQADDSLDTCIPPHNDTAGKTCEVTMTIDRESSQNGEPQPNSVGIKIEKKDEASQSNSSVAHFSSPPPASLYELFSMSMENGEQFGIALNSYFENIGTDLASIFDAKKVSSICDTAVETALTQADCKTSSPQEEMYLENLESRLKSVEDKQKGESVSVSPEIETSLVANTAVVVYDNDDLLSDSCCVRNEEFATIVTDSLGRSRSILRSEWERYSTSMMEGTTDLSNKLQQLTLRSAASPIPSSEQARAAQFIETREPQLDSDRESVVDTRAQAGERTASESILSKEATEEDDIIMTILLEVEELKIESREQSLGRVELVDKMRTLRQVLSEGKGSESDQPGETLQQLRELRRVLSDEKEPSSTQSSKQMRKKRGFFGRFMNSRVSAKSGDEQQFQTVMRTMKGDSKTKFIARIPTKNVEQPYEDFAQKGLPYGLVDAVLANKGRLSTGTQSIYGKDPVPSTQ